MKSRGMTNPLTSDISMSTRTVIHKEKHQLWACLAGRLTSHLRWRENHKLRGFIKLMQTATLASSAPRLGGIKIQGLT